ncbi:GIY-YIG nuclease family protein [Micromonospora chersina]|uniref:GIY-YIG nuclease family protein n=1 Tax=Micromonospora chersina TaxID=47854 RepID=UPI0033E435DE
MLDAEGLLADFTPLQPYTPEAAASAPTSPGVHVVLDRGTVVYVGWTGNLRNRLRQHLTGNRESSVLHQQVGQCLDTPARAATRQDVAGWLGRCEVRWQETDNPEAAKETLVLTLMPLFNRQIPKPRKAVEPE